MGPISQGDGVRSAETERESFARVLDTLERLLYPFHTAERDSIHWKELAARGGGRDVVPARTDPEWTEGLWLFRLR